MFFDNKYTRTYRRIVANAKGRHKTYAFEQHHIVPRCLGGDDKRSNLVWLSYREHYLCHWLLLKMVDDSHPLYYKLQFAFSFMASQGGGHEYRTTTARMYARMKEEARKAYKHRKSYPPDAEYMRQTMTGRVFIHRSSDMSFKRIKPEELDAYLSEGYLQGFAPWRKFRDYAGTKNPRYGVTVTDETKAKISAAKKGKTSGERNHRFGVAHTEDAKSKIQAAASNRAWITNGETTMRVLKDDLESYTMAGWRQGRAPFKR